MTLLIMGVPLSWDETKKASESIKNRAVKQFVDHFKKFKDFQGNSQEWGDEIEFTLVKFDHKNRQVKALLKAEDLLKTISNRPELVSESWGPEYSDFMIEACPLNPYNGLQDCVDAVEKSFGKRRSEIQALLDIDETIVLLGNFPRIGCAGFTSPEHIPQPKTSLSGSLMKSVVEAQEILKNRDGLHHTARGLLLGIDDRSEEERGLSPLLNDRYLIKTTRCDSLDMYVLPDHATFNDMGVPYCAEAYEEMVEAGVPHLFAQSMAHLFIRDPLFLFQHQLEPDCPDSGLDLFELIHCFHFQSGRIKLPPTSGESGWKFEFRPSEIQATDFQNAAVAVFMFLVTRLILEDKICFVLPITQVFQNMAISQKRDAVLSEKFHFRKSIIPNHDAPPRLRNEITKRSVDQIINGDSSRDWVGVADLVDDWLEKTREIDESGKERIRKYVNFVRDRASGKIETVAKWMRDFVRNHEKYERDSVVNEVIAYDIVMAMQQQDTC